MRLGMALGFQHGLGLDTKMSTMANKLAKASNSTIKHTLAYEANPGVHIELIQFAMEEYAFAR
eukprot:13071884-Ditylum_brightwellii.AAC.1